MTGQAELSILFLESKRVLFTGFIGCAFLGWLVAGEAFSFSTRGVNIFFFYQVLMTF
jgi:hypothetical protein